MNTIFDGPDEIDEEYQEILSAIEPDLSEEDCVHSPGLDDKRKPSEPGSLSSTTADLRLDPVDPESLSEWLDWLEDQERGSESNAYTNEEAKARRKEACE
jgi:hypothetical protein